MPSLTANKLHNANPLTTNIATKCLTFQFKPFNSADHMGHT